MTSTVDFALHPLCAISPRLTGPDLEELANDIKINGLLTPIVIHDGMILDGGNRYAACQKAVSVQPIPIESAVGVLYRDLL